MTPEPARSLQEMVLALETYWAERGCVVQQPYPSEVGAGTFNPATFLRSLGPEPWRVAYVEPSRRPKDGRYGENPNRFQQFFQYQVLLKPSPVDIVEQYFDSLRALGIDPLEHDLRLVEDDWESPTLGAAGRGLAGVDGRAGDLAVHLLPAVRRDRAAGGLGRADLRPRPHRHDAAGQGPRAGPGVVARRARGRRAGAGRARDLGRPVGAQRGRVVALQLRGGAGRGAVRDVQDLGGRGAAPARAPARRPRLRRGHQVLAPVQPARRPRRHLGERARRLHRPRAQAGARGGGRLREAARRAGLSADPGRGRAGEVGEAVRGRGRAAACEGRGVGRTGHEPRPPVRDRRRGAAGRLHPAGAGTARGRRRRRAGRAAPRPRPGAHQRHAAAAGAARRGGGRPPARPRGGGAGPGRPRGLGRRRQADEGAARLLRGPRRGPGRGAAGRDAEGRVRRGDRVPGGPAARSRCCRRCWPAWRSSWRSPSPCAGSATRRTSPARCAGWWRCSATRCCRCAPSGSRPAAPRAGTASSRPGRSCSGRPSDYFGALEGASVLANHLVRRERLRTQLEQVARDLGGEVLPDEALLDINTFMVEWPTAFAGSYDARFHDLPNEVIVSALREHQSFFTVQAPGSDGATLLDKFIAVRNGDERGLDVIRKGQRGRAGGAARGRRVLLADRPQAPARRPRRGPEERRLDGGPRLAAREGRTSRGAGRPAGRHARAGGEARRSSARRCCARPTCSPR